MTCGGCSWSSPFAAIEGFESAAITRSRVVLATSPVVRGALRLAGLEVVLIVKRASGERSVALLNP